jgi:hypothetical protein
LVQNGHHSKPKWSPYGAACLTPCKYPFPLKSVHFWIFNDFLNFYIGDHFENFKNRAQLWVIIYFCVKFQKDPLYGLNLTFFCTLVTMATATILNFSTPPKSCHTLRWIFLQSFMKFDERNPIFFLILPFCFYGNCGKVCPTDSDFFWLISFH